MTLLLLSAGELPMDPIWLRTLATVLPVAGTVVVALLTGPKLLERHRERKAERLEEARQGTLPPSEGPGVPAPVAIAATEKASLDPVLRLFIDDLHQRLSAAHEEAAALHQLRAVDAGTIARLTAEIADKEEKLEQVEDELRGEKVHTAALRRWVEQLRQELDAALRVAAFCKENHGNSPDTR